MGFIGGTTDTVAQEKNFQKNVKGVHLQTTSHNRKAVPFYRKLGFEILQETEIKGHPLLDDLTLITFAKKLTATEGGIRRGTW